MIKRIFAASCAVALALCAAQAEARSYGDLPGAEDGDEQVQKSPRRHAQRTHRHAHRSAGGGVSRTCLTSPAQALLGRIEAQFGPMKIVSTCRPGARIAGSGRISKHASGNAIDFDAGNRKGAVVQWLIANHKSGGTMTYSGMSHIHADIGPHFVSLGSGGGGRYASRSRSRSTYAAASSGRTYAAASSRRRTYASASDDGDDDAPVTRSRRTRRSSGDGPELARTQFDSVNMH